MTIKELILKANMVIPGYPLKFYDGLPIPVTDRTENGDVTKDCFVNGIVFHPKNSNFARNRGMMTGCYVVSMARSSKDYCMGDNSKESYMIMEDAVAVVLFTN